MTFRDMCCVKGLSTHGAGRGHATPHMPVETAKCWWLLKIEPNAWAGGKGSCAVCVDLLSPFLRGVGQALEKAKVLFLVTTNSPSLQAYAQSCMPSPRFAGR